MMPAHRTPTAILLSVALAAIISAVQIHPVLAAPQDSAAVGRAADTVAAAEAAPGWGQMTAEQRAQSVELSGKRDILYFVNIGVTILLMVVLLFSGLSGRMRTWASRVTEIGFLRLLLYFILFQVFTSVVTFPLSYYNGYHLEHVYGLSSQGFGGWLWDQVKVLGLNTLIFWPILGILFWLVRVFPRSWWAWFGVGSIPVVIFLVVISPIWITPLFFKQEPLEDDALKAQILDLAERNGITEARIFQLGASRTTHRLNAYVTGIGKTHRIVFFDNLVEEMENDEILYVMGHEMAHYLMNHVWIGVFYTSGFILVFGFVANLFMRRIIGRWQGRFGFSTLHNCASLPLIVLCASLFGFLFAPLNNGVSRAFEHKSDVFALETVRNNDAAVRALEKLAAHNLSNPEPSAFMEFWRYSHPKLSSRVNLARSYVPQTPDPDSLRLPGERHLRNIRQLTFGGQNAEAYFSFDGTMLSFQSSRDGHDCDRIYTMAVDGSGVRQVSPGRGVTTCAFIDPGGERIIFASTHLGHDSCPPKPSFRHGYVWPLYPEFDIFSSALDGSNLTRLTDEPGYDAEAVFSPDGSRILFTSVRDGDLDLYVMKPDGSDARRLTDAVGYDGGGFFSFDGARIVYRARHPDDPEEIADYQSLLRQGLVRPSRLEIFTMNADGTNKRQVTSNDAANFGPYFHPNGEQIIFVSNLHSEDKRRFDLFLINADGSGQEQVTFNETFDGFPMFSHDGTRLVWASNRNNVIPGETNVFIADWVP